MKKSIVLSLMLLLLFSGLASASLTDGLVAYYPFNGNANDESGNGNNGVVYGATLTSDRFGNPNSAYSFNGSSYILIQDSDVFNLTNNFTIGLWVDINSSGMLLNRHTNGINDDGSWWMAIQDAGIFEFQGTGTSPGNNNYWTNQLATTTTLPLNVWSQVVFSYDNANKTYNVYKDGQKVASGAMSLNLSNISNNLFIGSEELYGNFFNGSIDEVRIYNRVLSDSEIQQLYTGNTCSQADYNAAFEAGKQFCINSPASCGINTTGGNYCGSIVYNGLLPTIHYPCLNIGGTNYSVDFAIYSSNPLLFNVTGIGPTQ